MFKGKTPLFIAISLALVAGFLSYVQLQGAAKRVRDGWNPTPVLVAATEIPEGTVITFENLKQRDEPEQFVTGSVVRPENSQYVIGQRAVAHLNPGDPILWTQLETMRTAEKLSTKVQKKTRAITIEASKISSVGQWVRPNDHVDIIGTFRDPHTNQQVAVTLLQNVIVLATGHITGTTNLALIGDNARNYGDVSLLVIPEEAEILVLAGEMGKLTMSLRNEDDFDQMDERGRATIETLFSGERTRAMQERRERIIQVIRGEKNAPMGGGK